MTTLALPHSIDQEKSSVSAVDAAFNRLFIERSLAIHAEFCNLTGKRKQRQALEHGWETSTANNQIRVGEVFGSHPIEPIFRSAFLAHVIMGGVRSGQDLVYFSIIQARFGFGYIA
jgi:hypothetical protein